MLPSIEYKASKSEEENEKEVEAWFAGLNSYEQMIVTDVSNRLATAKFRDKPIKDFGPSRARELLYKLIKFVNKQEEENALRNPQEQEQVAGS